mgnify:CR=1 FL=1
MLALARFVRWYTFYMRETTQALVVLAAIGALSALTVYLDPPQFLGAAERLAASVFFKDSVTEASLKNDYEKAEKGAEKKRAASKVKILIVPGHDAEFPGTSYKNVNERELNLALAEELHALLKKEPRFEITLSQTDEGYHPELRSYFSTRRDDILAFAAKQKGLMERYVQRGKIARVVNIQHNAAPGEMVLRLYGINRFANENGIDIVLHIHFNDYPGRKRDAPGKYSGLAVYVPERQYSNAKGSQSVAEAVHKRLATLYPESDLPQERAGVVEDQELIALGASNTLDGAGMLIEYGYIYEPAWANPETREAVVDDLAFQTYLGIKDFFEEADDQKNTLATALLPHRFDRDLFERVSTKRDVLSLQAALALAGVYPPQGKTKNDCGLTGFFGPCTKEAVRRFQEQYNIVPAEGFVGEQTRARLHSLYGG